MDLNTTLLDAKFKDESPAKTVAIIKDILKSYGMETEEVWNKSSVPYCFGLRVTVSGTTFGVNGKGLTREFALASAYGELMERLQLGYIGTQYAQKDGDTTARNFGAMKVSADELMAENKAWYEAFSGILDKYTGVQCTARTILDQFADRDGMVEVDRYYNVIKKKVEYFPSDLRKRVYTANGCAAGNTMEEAVVQALGEIVERNYRLRIVEQKIALPDIPEEVIAKHEISYNIINFIRSMGYRVLIKDASLGTKYPVVCVIFISEKTGKYHTHFGAYPNFDIALSRALTESFQGRSLDNIAQFENFAKREDACAIDNMLNELVKGTSERICEFFSNEPAYEFNANVGFDGKNSFELFGECIEFFKELGYDVLVRDCSCLGFPTYQVIVPGYSEALFWRFAAKLDDTRYQQFAMNTLRDPKSAKLEDFMGLFMHLSEKKKMSTPADFFSAARLSVVADGKTQARLMAATLGYVCYALGKYQDVIKNIDQMLALSDEKAGYLLCLKRYLTLKMNKYDAAQIEKTLRIFHSDEVVAELNSALSGNPFDGMVLKCDTQNCAGCVLEGSCCQKRAGELSALIASKMQKMDFDDFVARITKVL